MNSMGFLKKMTGYEVEEIPNIQFRIMSIILAIRAIFFPVGKRLDQFGIDKGYVPSCKRYNGLS